MFQYLGMGVFQIYHLYILLDIIQDVNNKAHGIKYQTNFAIKRAAAEGEDSGTAKWKGMKCS